MLLTNTVDAGNKITAGYTFDDPDGDRDDSEFVWYKVTGGETSIIAGADTSYYDTSTGDGGSTIYVEVTPRSLTGFPDTGTPKTSGTCFVTATGSPSVSGVCISGNRSSGSELEGKYAGYDYPGSNSQLSSDLTIHKWFVESVEQSETSNKYTLAPEDVDKEIVYEMTPVAQNGAEVVPSCDPLVILIGKNSVSQL